MKISILAALGLLVLVAFQVAFADVALSNAQLAANLVPAGGIIQITQTSGNTTKTFSLQTKLMTEMAKGSAVNSVSTLIAETFLTTDAVDGTFQNIKASVATMSLDLPMDGTAANSSSVLSLTLTVSVFQEDGTVKLGSQSFPVDTGKLAISYAIVDWPFESYDNTLDVRVSITTPSAGGSFTAPELFLFNGASWTFSSTATIPAPYDSFYATSEISFNTVWSVESPSSSATRLAPFLSYLF